MKRLSNTYSYLFLQTDDKFTLSILFYLFHLHTSILSTWSPFPSFVRPISYHWSLINVFFLKSHIDLLRRSQRILKYIRSYLICFEWKKNVLYILFGIVQSFGLNWRSTMFFLDHQIWLAFLQDRHRGGGNSRRFQRNVQDVSGHVSVAIGDRAHAHTFHAGVFFHAQTNRAFIDSWMHSSDANTSSTSTETSHKSPTTDTPRHRWLEGEEWPLRKSEKLLIF